MALGIWNGIGLFFLIAVIYLSLRILFGKENSYD